MCVCVCECLLQKEKATEQLSRVIDVDFGWQHRPSASWQRIMIMACLFVYSRNRWQLPCTPPPPAEPVTVLATGVAGFKFLWRTVFSSQSLDSQHK